MLSAYLTNQMVSPRGRESESKEMDETQLGSWEESLLGHLGGIKGQLQAAFSSSVFWAFNFKLTTI